MNPGDSRATFEAFQAPEPATVGVAEWCRHVRIVLDALVDEQVSKRQRLLDGEPGFGVLAAEEVEAGRLGGFEQREDLGDV